ncbi:MAG: methyltransferase domain-containing protein [Betaproteobacteria bacterium]|nr:methyltransferase domain-containing protein [Betaproteobacteria bacterium]
MTLKLWQAKGRSVLRVLRDEGVSGLARRLRRRLAVVSCQGGSAYHGQQASGLAVACGMSKIEKALHRVDTKGRGLEIGPSHNPIAPKAKGFNIDILDHASQDALRQKYRDHGVNIDAIEEVDFIWRGEPLDELVGTPEAYDYIIASHVIEHTPDLVSFLQQCSRLLKPSGVLSLVIPDKRYCFDYFRWPSSTGDVLQAHFERRKWHPPGTVFDHVSLAAKLDGNIAWSPGMKGELAFVHSLPAAAAAWQEAIDSDDFIDVHQWRFTPSSFRLLLMDLVSLELVDLTEVCGFETSGCEFHITLERGAGVPNYDRLQLAQAILRELADGILANGRAG